MCLSVPRKAVLNREIITNPCKGKYCNEAASYTKIVMKTGAIPTVGWKRNTGTR